MFRKGVRIGVTGEIDVKNYDKDGQKVYVTEVKVSNVYFADGKQVTVGNDELPF